MSDRDNRDDRVPTAAEITQRLDRVAAQQEKTEVQVAKNSAALGELIEQGKRVNEKIDKLTEKTDRQIAKTDEKINKLAEKTNEKIDKLTEKTDRQIAKTDEKINKLAEKTDRQIAKTDEKIGKLAEKTDEKINKLAEKTDRQIAKTDEKINKLAEKTDRQIAKTDEKIDKLTEKTDRQIAKTEKLVGRLAKQIGGVDKIFGDMAEYVSFTNLERLLHEQAGIAIKGVTKRWRMTHEGRGYEFDLIALGTGVVVAIEVKTTLRSENVDNFSSSMLEFPAIFPEYRHSNIYGGFAYMKAQDGAEDRAHKHGMLTIRAIGGSTSQLVGFDEDTLRNFKH